LVGLLGYVVDLLAAVPSVIYGMWGLLFFVPKMTGFSQFLNRDFGWFRCRRQQRGRAVHPHRVDSSSRS